MVNLVRLLLSLLVATVLLSFSSIAPAQAVPYRASGGAQFVNQNDFVGTGHATHLGHYTETGNVSFTPTGNPVVLAVNGWAIYVAANGDQLHAVLSGELNTQTGAITATVRYVGGTGRFDDATGSSKLSGQMLGGTQQTTLEIFDGRNAYVLANFPGPTMVGKLLVNQEARGGSIPDEYIYGEGRCWPKQVKPATFPEPPQEAAP